LRECDVITIMKPLLITSRIEYLLCKRYLCYCCFPLSDCVLCLTASTAAQSSDCSPPTTSNSAQSQTGRKRARLNYSSESDDMASICIL